MSRKPRAAFDAFGLRRDATNWDYDLSQDTIATLKNYTDRGYTFQEELDNVELVHMNGRVYDPTVGRMISADPTVPDALFSQAFNRFAYVYDSPLEYTDPSGFVINIPGITVVCDLECQIQAILQNFNMFAGIWFYYPLFPPPVVPPGVGGHGGPGSHGSPKSPTNSTQPQQPTPQPPPQTTQCTNQAAAYVAGNSAYANQIQQQTGVSATNLLGLGALESNFGTSNLATNYNNYFGLTVGRAFGGTVGSYSAPTGYTFGVYPSPGFLTSGLSFAQSFQGAKVVGISNPAAFAAALTTPPLAFNSEPGYAGKLVARINQVAAC